MALIAVLCFILLILGLRESFLHRQNLEKIPVRIHVNGTRGKSTTTRLIAGALREAGFSVMAKTTGTAACLILEDGSEVPIKRRKTPSILEQLKVVANAARRQVDVLVVECMAINPEMQWVSEHQILKSAITVITNAREDHLDEMGPTRKDVASVLALTIPRNGVLVTTEDDFLPYFQSIARKMGTTVSLASAEVVAEEELGKFSVLMFPENVACALKVCELMNVTADVAFNGMWASTPDLGSTQVFHLKHASTNIFFVNALAANDCLSTQLVWQKWVKQSQSLLKPGTPLVGILNNRWDRNLRVRELADLTCSELNPDSLWLTGDLTRLASRTLQKRGFNKNHLFTGSSLSSVQILDRISEQYQGDIVFFAYGNTKGFGQELVDYFKRNGDIVDYGASSRIRRRG